MTGFLIHPLDPLVFGSGRPFTSVPGSRVTSRSLPPPSTLAGAVRTEAGRDANGRFDISQIETLLAEAVYGPLLAVDADSPELALPSPADAIRLRGDVSEEHLLRRRVPLELSDGDYVSTHHLAPVGSVITDDRKEVKSPPAFWTQRDLLSWLVDPPPPVETRPLSEHWGISGPDAEVRIHVRVDRRSNLADEGGLFSTEGRRFVGRRHGELVALAMYGETTADLPLPSHAVIGGEGRLSRLASCDRLVPEIPKVIVDSARNGFVRAYLATPLPLEDGTWQPTGVARIVGQAHGPPVVISGWSMAPLTRTFGYEAARNSTARSESPDRPQGGPKPVRRLFPAGSVFFLELSGSEDARESFVRDRWGASLLEGQDARDGFGLTLFGTWSGNCHPLALEDSP
ncbi:MAG: type III-B CRISPR module-associated Cmr3 family protein [Myxococcota bacterium]